jgi:hypothetical protein
LACFRSRVKTIMATDQSKSLHRSRKAPAGSLRSAFSAAVFIALAVVFSLAGGGPSVPSRRKRTCSAVGGGSSVPSGRNPLGSLSPAAEQVRFLQAARWAVTRIIAFWLEIVLQWHSVRLQGRIAHGLTKTFSRFKRPHWLSGTVNGVGGRETPTAAGQLGPSFPCSGGNRLNMTEQSSIKSHTLSRYTAAQIASALNLSKRNVSVALQEVPGYVAIARGGARREFTLADLPSRVRERLEASAKDKGFRTVESLLAGPSDRPAPALREIAPESLDRAAVLKRALEPALQRHGNGTLTEDEFNSLGVEDYRRIVGHEISERYWRRLFDRTISRDNGARDWERLHLYLDEKPKRARPEKRPQGGVEFRNLRQCLSSFQDRSRPDDGEMETLWIEIFDFYDAQIASGRKAKKVKGSLIEFLKCEAPFMGTHVAIRARLNRRLATARSQIDGKRIQGRLLYGVAIRPPEPSCLGTPFLTTRGT